jgi:hypothetical protein
MAALNVKPTVTKGLWKAPNVMPSWHQVPKDASEVFVGQQLPSQIEMRDYPYVQYWANVQEEIDRAAAENEPHTMETQPDEDAFGVPLPDRVPVAPVKPRVDVRIIFDEQCSKIEKGFVPLGVINKDGTQIKFVMPPHHMGDQINQRVFNIPHPIRSAAWQRYSKMYEVFLVLTKVLPVPLHTSPLALLMIRETTEVMRYKDAIGTLHGLHVLRHAMHEMDTENIEHKTRCWNFYKTLEAHIAERFYTALDKLAEEERAAGSSRDVAQETARKFGDAVSRFALDMVHAVEWCCMDILRLPYEMRKLFMTPNEFPSGETMIKVAFDQMRVQTLRYLGDRNKVYCGLYADEKDPKTGVTKRVYKGIDPNCWCPMQLDTPPLADRPYLLGAWKQDMDPQLAKSCLFGIYNGWIDLHTLREYMKMLEFDSRPETAAKMAALYNRPSLKEPAPAAGEAPVAMDTTADDTETAVEDGSIFTPI